MRRHGETRQLQTIRAARRSLLGLIGTLCLIAVNVNGQTVSNENLTQQVEKLTDAMSRAQAQLEQSQHELEQMRQQLAALQAQLGQPAAEDLNSAAAAKLAAQVDEIRERQDVALSQIATHEQSKVETDSKYPVRISGLILLNGFVNTGRVDTPATPTIALPGSGTTGATVRQTMLGIEAHGPHVLGAQSYGDLHIDFDGDLPSGYNGTGQSNGAELRLRTAHAGLRWQHTEAYFSFDRPILNPNTPASLNAVAVPALAWSGNLWSWNPQVGMTRDIPFSTGPTLRMQTALIAIIDPPPVYPRTNSSSSTIPPAPGTSEYSRWPGVETRFALLGSDQVNAGLQLGLGGIYAPHRTAGGIRFDTWAATADYRVPLAMRMELTGSAYRGQALGGLGNGGYKDYVYRIDPEYPGQLEYQAVDDMGGWVQLKQKATQRLEFNLAFGMDNVPAGQLRPYAGAYSDYYLNLARNKTYTGNVIFSPSAYVQFSLEYRHLASSPVNGWTTERDIIGVATGYRF